MAVAMVVPRTRLSRQTHPQAAGMLENCRHSPTLPIKSALACELGGVFHDAPWEMPLRRLGVVCLGEAVADTVLDGQRRRVEPGQDGETGRALRPGVAAETSGRLLERASGSLDRNCGYLDACEFIFAAHKRARSSAAVAY
jgi:hypothetical protein